MMRKTASTASSMGIALLFGILALTTAHAGEPKAYLIEPVDGARVSSPVEVKFGLKGMGVAPAGVEQSGTGHHHLLVDLDQLPPAGQPIPADDHHVHFGGGQTETSLDLEPGEHTLQLLLGDHLHRPHEPAVHSKQITITVE